MKSVMDHSFGTIGIIFSFVTMLGCSGSGQNVSAAPPPESESRSPVDSAGEPPALPSRDSVGWLVSDSSARTAELTLEVTRPPGSPSALLNGYRDGKVRVTVPLGWTVRWSWRNADSSSPHSLLVLVQREKIPLEGGRPTFSNAMTRSVTDGLVAGQTDQTMFVAEDAGWYWLMCGVPSHGLEGEWIELRVDPEAKVARVQVKS
jgi:hypothetical protein